MMANNTNKPVLLSVILLLSFIIQVCESAPSPLKSVKECKLDCFEKHSSCISQSETEEEFSNCIHDRKDCCSKECCKKGLEIEKEEACGCP